MSPTPQPTQAVGPTSPNEFFKMIAGTWRLIYGRKGTFRVEECSIDMNGYYYILSEPGHARCRLEDVKYDPDTREVRFTKQPLPACKGSPQVEILELNASCTEMVGYAERDRHSLHYTRLTADQHKTQIGRAISEMPPSSGVYSPGTRTKREVQTF